MKERKDKILSFLSFTDMPFKELSARRLLSAGENEYITHYFFCQHFFEFFFTFFIYFFLAGKTRHKA
ncbi:hypothetical protein DYE50_09955 [Treponema ruminis]|nr:hypothetical protein DYE50_09955 [Treponema ruminis]